jgi:hypothetical protein
MILVRLLVAAAIAASSSACSSTRFKRAERPASSFASLDASGRKSDPAVDAPAPKPFGPVRVDVAFDGNDASRISMPGYTRVVGQAKLVLNIGTLHASGDVKLVPYTDYARARYRVLFKGLRCFSDPDTIVATDPRYGNYLRTAKIDASGQFAFDKVYPGRYWVEATFENNNVLDKDYKPQICVSIGHVEVPDGGDAVVDFSAGPGI